MTETKQTKEEWLKEQNEGAIIFGCLALPAMTLLVGLFAAGIGCMFLNFLQAIGCGLVAGCLACVATSLGPSENTKAYD